MLTSALYHPGVLINKYGVLALAWDDTQALSCVQFGVDDVDNDNVDDSDEKLMVMMMATVKVILIMVRMVVMIKEYLRPNLG